EQLATRLASFDEALKAGGAAELGPPPEGSSTDMGPALERVQSCLRLLERVWPRRSGEAVAPADALPPGTRVGPYRVVGQRGMGVVYQALDTRLGRPVALKLVLAAPLPEERARFQTEAEAIAQLKHPNIIAIHEVGEYAGRPYLVLEWAEGGSLAERLGGAPLPGRAAAALLLPVAQAVAHAHGRGIVHRDLKPANVLLSRMEDGGWRIDHGSATLDPPSSILDLPSAVPKLTDFGLAKLLD